jgi:hypothetical protein
MKSGRWNARSLYVSSFLKTVASKLAKYKLQEVRWVEGRCQPADDYIFFIWQWKC